MTRSRHGWTLTVIAVAGFMATLDNTVVNVALPSIQRDLRVSMSTLEWVASGYILVFAGLMLAGGRLADVYGRKRIFLIGLAVFTGASLFAGLSASPETLIAARVVQGAGGALVLPSAFALVAVGRTDKERALGTVVWIGTASVAMAFGPMAGGYLVSHFHWGAIFLINIPPGILAFIAGVIVLPESRDAAADRVDWPGVLTSGTALFCLTYGLIRCARLIELSRQPLGDPAVLSVFGLAGVSVAALVLVERWARAPMIDMEFFRRRMFAGGVAIQVFWGIGFNGVLFYASIFLQTVLGFSPPKAGAVFLPPAIAIGVLTPVAFWLGRKVGGRATIGGGVVLMAAGMATFALLRPGDGYASLMPGVLLIGVGSALTMPLGVYALKGAPEERAGVASGIIGVAREVSGALGITVIGVIIISREHAERAAGKADRVALQHATPYGLLVGAGLVLLGAVIAAATLPGRERRSHHSRYRLAPAETAAGPPALWTGREILDEYGAYRRPLSRQADR